jgi:hypothetical protein
MRDFSQVQSERTPQKKELHPHHNNKQYRFFFRNQYNKVLWKLHLQKCFSPPMPDDQVHLFRIEINTGAEPSVLEQRSEKKIF